MPQASVAGKGGAGRRERAGDKGEAARAGGRAGGGGAAASSYGVDNGVVVGSVPGSAT